MRVHPLVGTLFLLLLVLLSACGGGNDPSSSRRVSIAQEEVVWQGYANQREDLFDKFNYSKDCLKSFGNQPVREGYPYVTITNKMVPCPDTLCLGCTDGTYVFVSDRSPDWVYTHEFIHFIMNWIDESHPELSSCIEVSVPISCPTNRSERK